jgi:hypothetical protein
MIMKHNTTLKTLAALTTIALTQPLMAIYSVDSTDCYAPTNVKTNTINVSKFTNVWQELHRDNAKTDAQVHLQTFINSALDNIKGKLDVAKFSSVWQNVNANSEGTAHLSQYMGTLLDNAFESKACSSAPLLCDASIDIAKFSTLWNEVRVNNNNASHLNSALGSTVSSTVCSI